jgi:hypothetical protein
MKTKIISILVVFVLAIGILSGCGGFQPLSGGPSVDATVTSNGGMAVQKGNYLYFVNGFVSSQSLVEGDNKYGDVQNAGIYRAQLNESNGLMYDEEDNLVNVELLVPKVVGFENGGLYLFDNYIFYASPTILKDRTGEVQFDLLDFYMAKLDGTGVTKIYATEEYSNSATFAFYKLENIIYLVVFDGSKIVSVKIENAKASSPVTMVESATSVAFPKITEYNANNNSVALLNQFIYYTRSLNDSDNTIIEVGNVLAKVKIGTTLEEKLIQDNVWTYSLGRVLNNSLYYSKHNNNTLSSKQYFRSLEENNFLETPETQLTTTYYKNVAVLQFEAGNNRGVVVSNDSELLYVKNINEVDGIELLVAEKVTVLFAIGDYVYYTYGENNRLARVNVKNKTIENLTNEEDTFKVDVTLKADYDNEYIYLYKKHTGNSIESYYLERIQYMTSSFTSEFVGVMEEKHIEVEEETAE